MVQKCFCFIAEDHCEPNACPNGCECINLSDTYECNCDGSGFTGIHCETGTIIFMHALWLFAAIRRSKVSCKDYGT